MPEQNYIEPDFNKDAYNCPSCGVYADQTKGKTYHDLNYRRFDSICLHDPNDIPALQLHCVQCSHCKHISLWLIDNLPLSGDQEKMIYPLVLSAPLPNSDMPDNVKKTFEEARHVQPHSVRATVVLLRVALEELTEHLGETKGTLYDRIKNLQKQGLSEKTIELLNVVRIFGNKAGSHAGSINLEGENNKEIVDTLFLSINLIAEETISHRKKIDAMHKALSEKKQGIENRDRNQN